MIRIHRVHDTMMPSDRDRIAQVQAIFRAHFPQFGDYDRKIPQLLADPFRYGYRAVLLVSERTTRHVTGFALLLHFPEINSSLLDFLAVAPDIRGGGVGQALYEAAREYLKDLGSRGMYLEVWPDDPDVVTDPDTLADNRRRLRFYERYGVRPIINTAYETPIDSDPAAPHLLFDPLGRDEPLRRHEARAAVRLILRRKYADLVGPDYIERVVESFVDDPVRFRAPKYVRPGREAPAVARSRLERRFALVAGQHHAIHHVRERGYVERPARVGAILEGLEPTGLFDRLTVRRHGEGAIRAVHDADYVRYLKAVCEKLAATRPIYPYVFPIRRPERRPKDLAMRAGYYCIDTFTPLDRNAYLAAREAVDVALTAAEALLAGRRVVYALCRPPGHHAGRRTFGGFCYFNNAAVAAHVLAATGPVAVLDIDYHHGNGTQDIFYERSDVLTLSIHCHPNEGYPYFSGFADETGAADGRGFNRNYPLSEGADEATWMAAFGRALERIERFGAMFLLLALGLDMLRGDPTGSFALPPSALGRIGARLAALGPPILVVQEGGYNLRNLRRGPAALFGGMAEQWNRRVKG